MASLRFPSTSGAAFLALLAFACSPASPTASTPPPASAPSHAGVAAIEAASDPWESSV